MRVLTLTCFTVACLLPIGAARPSAADCPPAGTLQFVCGQAGPEDLEAVPGSPWVIVSGYAAGSGSIRAVDTRDHSTTVLYPTGNPSVRPDTRTYDACPGPMDPKEPDFRVHGIYLRPGRNAVHTLYAVHHGAREAVEVFELDARGATPALTWVGCAIPPYPVGLNAVVALPDGGMAATNWRPRDNEALAARMRNGEKNGEVWEWHSRIGWKIIPGTESSGANGLEISKDGRWLYVAGWGDQTFSRISRGQTPVKRDTIPLGFRADNLRWLGNRILAGGQGGAPSKPVSMVVTIDPETLRVDGVIHYEDNDTWGAGTTAIRVGDELWVGAIRGERIARFPFIAGRVGRSP